MFGDVVFNTLVRGGQMHSFFFVLSLPNAEATKGEPAVSFRIRL
jgi:hypothetical protein